MFHDETQVRMVSFRQNRLAMGSALGALALATASPVWAQAGEAAAASPAAAAAASGTVDATATTPGVTPANPGDVVTTTGSVPTSSPERQADGTGNAADIVVTGSRITRSGFNSPTPVAVVGAERIEKLGANNLGDALFQVPAFRAGSTPSTSGLTVGSIGARFADLRGLGPTRTLVLLDGRRIVPSTSVSTVDLNVIPSILVQRTEVVTGGASAAYGSDAVAGVVNIIMDNKFEGMKGNVQYGTSRYGDGKDYSAALAVGTSFGGGRGHIVLGGEYEDSKAVGDCYTRPWCSEERQALTNSTPGLNGIPGQVITRNVHTSTQTRGGLITAGPLKGTQFAPDGTPVPFTYGDLAGNLFQIGGSGEGQNAYITLVDIRVPVERYTSYGHASYDFTDSITGYVEGNYARVDGRNIGGASRNAGDITIQADNAFLPAALKARIATYNDANPAAPITNFKFGREGYDIGPAVGRDLTTTYRGVVGVDIDLGHSWKINAYYQYGRSNFVQTIQNNQAKPLFNFAVDAVVAPNGTIVCRATLSANAATRAAAAGCAPLNLFGQYNFSQDARNYAYQTSTQTRDLTQNVESASIQGEPFSTWAGPVSVGAGVEHRTDRAVGDADALSKALAFTTGNGNAIDGRIAITEGYVETIVPLLKDMFLAKSLELNASARRTHYSTSGNVTTWKVGLVYEPTSWARLRATRSRDIRAPNLSELFNPTIANQSTINDTATRTQGVFPFRSGGNPNLQPERASTTTAGIVLQPQGFLQGVRLSVDYYKIRVKGAIATLVPQNVVTQCNTGNTEFCQYVQRGPDGLITLINTPFLNLNTVKTSGFDIVADYALPLNRISASLPGKLDMDLTATYVAHLTTVQATGSLDIAGVTGCSVTSFFACVPHWTVDGTITYDLDRLSLTAHGHYIPKSVYDPTLIGPQDDGYSPSLPNSISTNRENARFYLSLNISYNLIDDGKHRVQLFGNVDNVTDVNPPLAPGRSNNTFYDPVGRFYKMGVRVQY